MNLFPAASIPWLLLHELRLTFRGGTRANRVGLAIAGSFIVIVALTAGFPIAHALRDEVVSLTPFRVALIDAAVVVLFTLFFSQTLSNATMALYERGDLDLLLSSPVPARRVLTVRALAIATAPFIVFAGLLSPMLIPLALNGHAPWLGAFAVLAALALSATACGLMVAMGLFALIGPRRTRTAGQLLAALVGAAFFITAQLRNLLPHQATTLYAWLAKMADGGYFDPATPAGWPALAVTGAPLELSAVVAAAVLLFSAAAGLLGARFSRNAAAAAGIEATYGPTRRVDVRFRSGRIRSLVEKELVLLRRDPALVSQVLLRVLYLMPLVFVLTRSAFLRVAGQLETSSGVLVFASAQVAASLAWITISAEDAPDFLKSAPMSRMQVRFAKILAALLPLAVVLGVPILLVASFSPWVGIVTAIGVAGASISMAYVNLWFEAPGQRKTFRRRGGGSLVGNIAALALGASWSATTVGAAHRSPWAALGVAVTLAMLVGFRAARSSRES